MNYCLMTSVTGKVEYLQQLAHMLVSVRAHGETPDLYITCDDSLLSGVESVAKQLEMNLKVRLVETPKDSKQGMNFKFASLEDIPIEKYENVMYVDSDILFLKNPRLLLPTEDLKIEKKIILACPEHGRDLNGEFFGEGNFSSYEMEELRKADANPINAGFVVFSCSKEGFETMKNLRDFIYSFKFGFYDQTAANLFLHRNNLVNTSFLDGKMAFGEYQARKDSHAIHFIGAGDRTKSQKMFSILKSFGVYS